MKLDELRKLAHLSAALLAEKGMQDVCVTSVNFPDSPNPLCYIEIDVEVFLQGSFWSNNEFRIDAIDNRTGDVLVEMNGKYRDIDHAVEILTQAVSKLP